MKHHLALTMIVRDEEQVIERVMTHMLLYCDSWCIVDTGSKDRTKQLIREIAAKLNKPGELHDRPWVNHFGKSRSEALALAAQMANWAFMCDADDYCTGPLPELQRSVAAYYVRIQEGNDMQHRRLQIFNLQDYDFWYQQAVHEIARCHGKRGEPPKPHVDVPFVQVPPPFVMVARREGARSRDPKKYLRDAEYLLADLHNPDSLYPRTVFYLAQSYRDAQLPEKARKWYRKSAELAETWSEERYIACLNLVRLAKEMPEKMEWAWKAQAFSPQRKEAAYEMLKWTREKNLWREEVYAMGFTYKGGKPCDEFLFVELPAYSWRYLDELGIHAFYTRRYRESLVYTQLALAEAPADEQSRLRKNLQFAQHELSTQADLSTQNAPKST